MINEIKKSTVKYGLGYTMSCLCALCFFVLYLIARMIGYPEAREILYLGFIATFFAYTVRLDEKLEEMEKKIDVLAGEVDATRI